MKNTWRGRLQSACCLRYDENYLPCRHIHKSYF